MVVRISQPQLLHSNEYRMATELSAQTRARKHRQPDRARRENEQAQRRTGGSGIPNVLGLFRQLKGGIKNDNLHSDI